MSRWPLLALLVLPASASADLATVDRTLKREPTYATTAGYCLLVFGPDLAHRVWLVRDGDTLYADTNGNGDLTDPGEKFAAEKDRGHLAFHVGTVRLGKRDHRHLTVRGSPLAGYGGELADHPVTKAALKAEPKALLMSVNAEIDAAGLTGGGDGGRLQVGARIDADGPLLFAATPAAAQVIHLGGPLHLRGETSPTLYRGVVHDLMLYVGTPGVGPGSFAIVGYEKLIPDDAFVVVEAEFPGDPPRKERFALKERC